MQIQPLDPAAPSTAAAAGGVVVARVAADDAGSAAPAPAAPTRAEVEAAAKVANAALQERSASLEFTVDPDTHDVVVRLIDLADRTVLRQIPSPEMLAIAKAIDRMELALLRETA